jgi:membrane protease YdiL (CAAX protease family)
MARLKPIASWAHTAVLLGILTAIAVAGAVGQTRAMTNSVAPTSNATIIPLYLSLIAAEWALVLYTRRGFRRTATTITELLGGPIWERKRLEIDVLLGGGLWAAWQLIEAAWTHWWGPVSDATVRPFLAHSPIEIAVWIALSVSAGFAEELVFRGYLQRQFTALTRSVPAGLVMQALVFGVSHGYQGVRACVRITAFGVLFGLIAVWQRRLRPGVLAHALTDIVAGLT